MLLTCSEATLGSQDVGFAMSSSGVTVALNAWD
jgi:hypothetical protein